MNTSPNTSLLLLNFIVAPARVFWQPIHDAERATRLAFSMV